MDDRTGVTGALASRARRAAVALAVLLTAASPVGSEAGRERARREDVAALPDEAFAVVRIRPDGTRWRRLPHHAADGRLDLPHLRSALARLGQVHWEEHADAERAGRHLLGHADALGWRIAGQAHGADTGREERRHRERRAHVDPWSGPP